MEEYTLIHGSSTQPGLQDKPQSFLYHIELRLDRLTSYGNANN